MFSFRNGIWQQLSRQISSSPSSPISRSASSTSSTLSTPTKLRIAFYNVLFDHFNTQLYGGLEGPYNEQRFHHQLDSLLPALNADIIGLNEANPLFLQLALQKDWIQQDYLISQIDYSHHGFKHSSRTNCQFGNLMLMKKNSLFFHDLRLENFEFPSYWRSALKLSFEMNEQQRQQQKIVLLLCHLKAGDLLPEIENRKLQLQCIEEYFEKQEFDKSLILMFGDLNIVKENENAIPSGFFDLYLEKFKNLNENNLEKPSLEFTFDGKFNKLIGDLKFRQRFDRVYCKLPSNNSNEPKLNFGENVQEKVVLFKEMQLFGTEQMKIDDLSSPLLDKPASDHYGVYFDLEINV